MDWLGTYGHQWLVVSDYGEWSGVQVGVVHLYSTHHCKHFSLAGLPFCAGAAPSPFWEVSTSSSTEAVLL